MEKRVVLIVTFVLIVVAVGLLAVIGIRSATIKPDVVVTVISRDRNDQMFTLLWKYRIMLPDSTVDNYNSNKIFYVGDKIKI